MSEYRYADAADEVVAKVVLTVGQVVAVIGAIFTFVGGLVLLGAVPPGVAQFGVVFSAFLGVCYSIALFVVFARVKQWPSITRKQESAIRELQWELDNLREQQQQ